MKSDVKAVISFMALFLLFIPEVCVAQWSEAVEFRRREDVLVSYRAKLDGNMLIIEASHAPGWHTYAMDNVERARKKSGKDNPETELPTQIELSGELKVVGNWFQSEPKDLSQMEIRWYSWGFENVAWFAVEVEGVEGGEATITISGQACDATSCISVDGLTISLPLPSSEEFAVNAARTSVDLSRFVEIMHPGESSGPAEKSSQIE